MPVSFNCPNGHPLSVKDEFAGKKAKCPKCGAMMVVPKPAVSDTDAGYEVIDDDVGYSVIEGVAPPAAASASSASVAGDEPPRRAATAGKRSVAGRSAATDSSSLSNHRNILVIAGGAGAGFCVVVAAGILLILQFRAGSKLNDAPPAVAQAPTVPLAAASTQPANDPQSPAAQPDPETPPAQVEPQKTDANDLAGDALATAPPRNDPAAKPADYVPNRRAVTKKSTRRPYTTERKFSSADGAIEGVLRFSQAATNSFDDAGTQIRVLDVKRLQTAERDLPGWVLDVRATPEFVLVLYDDSFGFKREIGYLGYGSTVDVLRTSDLSLIRTLALTHTTNKMEVHDNRLAVFSSADCVRLPELTQFWSGPPPDPPTLEGVASRVRLSPNGWLIGPAAFDATNWSFKFFHSLSYPLLAPELNSNAVGLPLFGQKNTGTQMPSTTPGSAMLDSALVLYPKSTPAVLPAKGKHTVQYVAEGGTPPYKFSCSVPGVEAFGINAPKDIVQVDESKGSVVIDCSKLSELLMNDHHSFQQKLGQLAANRAGAAAGVVNDYIKDANEYLQPLLSRTFRDFPLAVTFAVQVNDSANKIRPLSHQMILELPRSEVLKIVDKAIATDRYDSTVGSPHELLRRRLERTPPRSFKRPVYWTDTSQLVEFSNLMRELWPDTAVPDKYLEPTAILSILTHRFRDDWKAHPAAKSRVWKRSDGSTEKGSLVTVSSNGPIEINPRPPSQALLLSLLDEASTKQIWSDAQPSGSKRGIVCQAIMAFHTQYGCFPPHALVGKQGRPLLSWRLLVLPQMGYTSLFRLFHLDEPWNSPHNRKLIPYMPEHFSTAEEPLPPGRSNIAALVGPNTAFPSGRMRRMADFVRPGRDTLFAVDVAKEFAVEWTKPDDLELTDDGAAFDRVYQHVRSGDPQKYFVGMFGEGDSGVWEEIAPDDNRQQLSSAANIENEEPSGLRKKKRR